MKYQASLPEKNDNVSHNHPVKEFFILLSGLIIIFLLIYWSLGFFVDFAVNRITPENEAVLFAKINFNKELKIEASSGRQAELQNITDSLGQCIEVPYPVTLRLADSEHVNALAFPGGTIIVFKGLLEKIKSENGIAFVLAHELGHYVNRDHLRAMGREIVLLALSTLMTGADSGITQLLAPAKAAGYARYSQRQESTADRTALQALNCLYGHVGGATEFFEALADEERWFDNKAVHYFSSHPELQKRIDDLNSLAQSMGFQLRDVNEISY